MGIINEFRFYKNELTSAIFVTYGQQLIFTIQNPEQKRFVLMISNTDGVKETEKELENCVVIPDDEVKQLIERGDFTDFMMKNVEKLGMMGDHLNYPDFEGVVKGVAPQNMKSKPTGKPHPSGALKNNSQAKNLIEEMQENVEALKQEVIEMRNEAVKLTNKKNNV